MSQTPIRDGAGRVIGYNNSDGTLYDVTGKVVARYRGDTTYNGANGKVEGKGDQRLRLLKNPHENR